MSGNAFSGVSNGYSGVPIWITACDAMGAFTCHTGRRSRPTTVAVAVTPGPSAAVTVVTPLSRTVKYPAVSTTAIVGSSTCQLTSAARDAAPEVSLAVASNLTVCPTTRSTIPGWMLRVGVSPVPHAPGTTRSTR